MAVPVPGSPQTKTRQVRANAWIAGSLKAAGTLTVDDGALAALERGRSLLPAGVTAVDGRFERGDAVLVKGPDGQEIGRGLGCLFL